MPDTWEGSDEIESWKVEIETDCFDEGRGLEVVLWVEVDEGSGAMNVRDALATPTPQQAREIADELRRCADLVETVK